MLLLSLSALLQVVVTLFVLFCCAGASNGPAGVCTAAPVCGLRQLKPGVLKASPWMPAAVCFWLQPVVCWRCLVRFVTCSHHLSQLSAQKSHRGKTEQHGCEFLAQSSLHISLLTDATKAACTHSLSTTTAARCRRHAHMHSVFTMCCRTPICTPPARRLICAAHTGSHTSHPGKHMARTGRQAESALRPCRTRW